MNPSERSRPIGIATLGIDLGKNTIHTMGLDEQGHPMGAKKFTRTGLIRYLAKLAPCRVAMEACAGSHYVARKAEAMGHEAVLLPGQFVQPYIQGQKTTWRLPRPLPRRRRGRGCPRCR